ncbi:protein kinase [Streptomyces sp. NPDC050560]|uniref:protein kinase domain-containing protein n=1 Tax=Streptomyces sp. NPDC050560 TaxID=3365630 RepID=UPI0037A70E6A
MSDSAAVVRLTVVKGPAAGTEYRFETRATCVIGRASDCRPRLPRTDKRAARYHCLLDVNPPALRLRGLGTAATRVNGEEIAAFPGHAGGAPAGRDLVDGDEIRLGETLLRIGVEPRAAAPRGGPEGEVSLPPGYEALRELSRAPGRVVRLARRLPGDDLVDLVTLRAAGPGGDGDAFLRAVQRLRGLRHERIARLYDGGARDDGSGYWLAYEHCGGGTLEELLTAHGGTLPPARAVAVAVGLLDGLAYAHGGPGAPLLHGAVAPSNVLVTATAEGTGGSPVVKLGRFGVDGAFDRAGLAGLTRAGATTATAAYLPRTRLTGHPEPGPEADVWGAAAVLCRMLTGAAPRDFPAGTDPLLVLLRDAALPVRQRAPSLPQGLARVVDAALIDTPGIVTRQATALGRALADVDV